MPFRFFIRRRRSRKSKTEYTKHKEAARELVLRRLSFFNQFYGYKIGKIAIRNQKSRWGSCSTKGNLNFNYKLAIIPSHLADYVIVHELCHLGEFNHSQKFWDLVAKTMPDYKKMRDELKHIALSRIYLHHAK